MQDTISKSEINEIVNKHNALRRGVRPPASNMLKMSWNKQAAANAQKWANKCTMKHSLRRLRRIRSSGCGENLYMSSSKTSWSDAIQSWYDEVKNFRYGKGSVNKKPVGHYTQVVWYKSNYIGCAMANCPKARNKFFYVCHYCPPGNYQLARPYKAGRPCGQCRKACNNKLCTNPCRYTNRFSNCPQLAKSWGCKHLYTWCPASCRCRNKII